MIELAQPPAIIRPAPFVAKAPHVWRPSLKDMVVMGMLPGMTGAVSGFTGGGGGFISDIYKPATTTRLLGISFASDTTTFTENSITGAVTGTLTHNASGGAGNGGYATGWTRGTNFIGHNSLVGSSATSADWLTLFMWIKTSDTGTSDTPTYGPRLVMFGESAGTLEMQMGLTAGKLHVASNTATPQGATSIADNAWHLCCFQQTAQSTWKLWYDNIFDGTATPAGAAGGRTLTKIGSGFAYTNSIAPPNVDGVQIFRPSLSDAQVQEVYTNAGF